MLWESILWIRIFLCKSTCIYVQSHYIANSMEKIVLIYYNVPLTYLHLWKEMTIQISCMWKCTFFLCVQVEQSFKMPIHDMYWCFLFFHVGKSWMELWYWLSWCISVLHNFSDYFRWNIYFYQFYLFCRKHAVATIAWNEYFNLSIQTNSFHEYHHNMRR